MERIFREEGRKKKRGNACRSESEEELEDNPKKNWRTWPCPACTFRNTYSSSSCTMCHQERYQQSDSSQEEEVEEEDALASKLRTVRQRLVPQKKPDHRPRKRAFESTPKKAVASRPATTTTTTTATAALPFVFGAPPALSPTAPGGLFGVFDSSKMVIKFTGGSENETVKKEEQEEKEEESKEGDDLGEGTSDKKPHKGAQTAVYELPVPELEKQIKTLELSLASVNATKADLTERLASVGAQITDLTDRKTLLQALVKIRKDNERLEKEADRAQQRRTEVEDAIAQARRELEALSLERDQRAEELESIKQEKIEIKQLAAKKKEVEDLASELESRKTAADALRARLEEAETTLAADRESLDEERQALAEEKLKMNNLQEFASRKVKLNVGGTYFQTSLTTLTQVPSMFSAMFSGKYRMEADEDGCHFIDRDPTHFRYVLNFLRDSRIEVPAEASRAFVRELLAEAEFYQVEGLIAILALGDPGAASGGAAAPAFAFTFSSSPPTRPTPPLPPPPPSTSFGASTVPSSTTRIHSRPYI